MNDVNDAKESQFYRIAYDLKEGNAPPEDSHRLLEYAYEILRKENPGLLAPWMLTYLHECLAQHFESGCSLDAAFGLIHKSPGQPTKQKSLKGQEQYWIAGRVLEHRLCGESLEAAAEIVAREYHISESKVRKIWGENKEWGLITLQISRKKTSEHWSCEEKEKLNNIYKSEPWYRPLKY